MNDEVPKKTLRLPVVDKAARTHDADAMGGRREGRAGAGLRLLVMLTVAPVLPACDAGTSNGTEQGTSGSTQSHTSGFSESALLVSSKEIEGPDNYVVGHVVIEPLCVYIHLTEPEDPAAPDRAVIWPRGTELSSDGFAVVLPDGKRVPNAEVIAFQGAGMATNLDSSLLEDVEVSPAAAQCALQFERMIAFGGIIPAGA